MLNLKITNFLILIVIFNLLLLDSISCNNFDLEHRFVDNLEMAMKRLNFGRNYTDQVTKGKVIFDYSDKKGVHCKANSDLGKKEFVFKIPNKLVKCSFDIFPYKIELIQAVNSYFLNKYGQPTNTTRGYIMKYTFALDLMFAVYDKKEQIYNHLRFTARDFYINEYTEEFMEYLESLPAAVYTSEMYSDEERKLMEVAGIRSSRVEETEGLHMYLINYVEVKMASEAVRYYYLILTKFFCNF